MLHVGSQVRLHVCAACGVTGEGTCVCYSGSQVCVPHVGSQVRVHMCVACGVSGEGTYVCCMWGHNVFSQLVNYTSVLISYFLGKGLVHSCNSFDECFPAGISKSCSVIVLL